MVPVISSRYGWSRSAALRFRFVKGAFCFGQRTASLGERWRIKFSYAVRSSLGSGRGRALALVSSVWLVPSTSSVMAWDMVEGTQAGSIPSLASGLALVKV
jgi:hypothetical protein